MESKLNLTCDYSNSCKFEWEFPDFFMYLK